MPERASSVRAYMLSGYGPNDCFDRATIRHNLTEFKLRWLAHIEQWKAENRPATESSHDQQFWGDLLDCFGVNARDLYQRGAKRASTGRTGKIDMFMPGKVIDEAKSLDCSPCAPLARTPPVFPWRLGGVRIGLSRLLCSRI